MVHCHRADRVALSMKWRRATVSRPRNAPERFAWHIPRASATFVSLALLLSATTGRAASYTWFGTGTSGGWSNATNWATTFFPPPDTVNSTRNGNDLVFDRDTRLTSTNDVGAPVVTYGSITFLPSQGGPAVGAGAFTISGTTFAISGTGRIVNSSTNTQTFTVSSINLPGPGAATVSVTGAPLVFDTVVTGSGGLTKTGAGRLDLLRTPTLTGTTTVQGGTLVTGTGVTAFAAPLAVMATGTVSVIGPTSFSRIDMTGGALLPGGTAATAYSTLSATTLALSGSARVVMGVGPPSTADRIVVTGTAPGSLTYGGTLSLDLTGLGSSSYVQMISVWNLFDAGSGGPAGALSAMTSVGGVGPYAGLSWSRDAFGMWMSSPLVGEPTKYLGFDETTGKLAVVPEPGTLGLAVLGLGGAAVLRRIGRRRSAAAVVLLLSLDVSLRLPVGGDGPRPVRVAVSTA